MAKAKVKYKNLYGEMARIGLTIQDIAQLIGRSRTSTSNKLSGKHTLSLDEALLIKKTFFPNETIEYLFVDTNKE